jgi:hypothetical protein
MRFALVAAVVFGVSTAVAAQSPVSRSDEFFPLPTIGLPLPHIGLPLPEIGLPLPPIGLTPPAARHLPVTSDRTTNSERQLSHVGERRSRHPGQTVIYFVPSVGWGYPNPMAGGLPGQFSAPPEEKRPRGRVRLQLQPDVNPQLYVDGYYVGTLDDVIGELILDVGVHKIEMRADGYETLEVNVQVSADRPITYRGALKRVDAIPAPVPAAPPPADVPPPLPATIYVIPGCYVGNVPPADAGLPAGCDERRAIAFTPRP